MGDLHFQRRTDWATLADRRLASKMEEGKNPWIDPTQNNMAESG